MIKIKEKYEYHCNMVSDINEHLPTLYKFAKECNHITEMGVRWVSSTWPLLLSNPEFMISYDIVKNENISEVVRLSEEYKIKYEFVECDVLNVEIEETDLLFIDTLHTYSQLIQELKMHSNKVKKYIILHDTETYGLVDEPMYDHASEKVKGYYSNKQGLNTAVDEFLNSDKGHDWYVLEKFKNNNGLTILKKK